MASTDLVSIHPQFNPNSCLPVTMLPIVIKKPYLLRDIGNSIGPAPQKDLNPSNYNLSRSISPVKTFLKSNLKILSEGCNPSPSRLNLSISIVSFNAGRIERNTEMSVISSSQRIWKNVNNIRKSEIVIENLCSIESFTLHLMNYFPRLWSTVLACF